MLKWILLWCVCVSDNTDWQPLFQNSIIIAGPRDWIEIGYCLLFLHSPVKKLPQKKQQDSTSPHRLLCCPAHLFSSSSASSSSSPPLPPPPLTTLLVLTKAGILASTTLSGPITIPSMLATLSVHLYLMLSLSPHLLTWSEFSC